MSLAAEVVIIGAGIAGLAAAQALTGAGRSALLLDKGRRPGGRCATRTLGDATMDTGAQFFTVRSEEFARQVSRWRGEGCPIRVWAHGFAQAPRITAGPASAHSTVDGHPRHSVEGGMNRLAAHLARDLDIRCGTRAMAIRPDTAGWLVEVQGSPPLHARAVVLTPPLPQAIALLASGEVALAAGDERRLRAQSYQPCLTLMVALDEAPALPPPGGVQFAGGEVGWLGDNQAKGTSTAPSLTVHASGAWSEVRYDQAREQISADLLDLVRPWLGAARPISAAPFRWRYAQPLTPLDEGAIEVCHEPGPLLLAGDALAGGKIEGAFTSGSAAAARLLNG